MLSLSAIKNGLGFVLGRGGLIISKYSPEITLGLGLVGVVASTVLTYKATLRIDEVKQENMKDFVKIAEGRKAVDLKSYPDEDYKADLRDATIRAAGRYIRLYGPAVTTLIASIALILASHGILSNRNAALMAAYKALDEGFAEYRKRVMEKLGAEKDRAFRFGEPEEISVKEEVIDEKGKVKTKETKILKYPGESIYARWYDDKLPTWRKDPMQNEFFLKSIQNWANDRLHIIGHIFLNEVYDAIGFPHTKEGCIVGWVKNGKDGCVDFLKNAIVDESLIDGRTNPNPARLLDFNVDGVIWNMI